MPSARSGRNRPPESLDALLDRILAELRAPADPLRLEELRAAFRRRIPLRLRAYAAALLLDWSLGSRPAREGGKEGEAPGRLGDRGSARAKARGEAPEARAPRARKAEGGKPGAPAAEAPTPEADRPRFQGEGLTLFFGMGKRQRLNARALLGLLVEEAGLSAEDIGQLRIFDNYAFADLDPAKAEAAMTALEGFEWRGRPLPVSRAKKREAGGREGEAGAGA